MAQYTLTVNGQQHQVDVAADTPILWVLRDHLDLVGTKFGCGIAECGACTIHVDGVAIRSCTLAISKVGSGNIITIEGIGQEKEHALQKAWIEHDVPQCGYCQAGQIMNAATLLTRNPNPTDGEIDTAMNGNLCRCGTYIRVKAAIKTAAANS
jgi:isoquinoline 1-oxidoreductase alpha subunit